MNTLTNEQIAWALRFAADYLEQHKETDKPLEALRHAATMFKPLSYLEKHLIDRASKAIDEQRDNDKSLVRGDGV